MVEMVTGIEPAHHHELDRQPDREGQGQGGQHAEQEGTREGGDGGAEKRPHHVQRAMRQIDEIHDAEHQGQSGGEQKQQHPQLKPVERLDDQKGPVHIGDFPASTERAGAPS